MFTYNKERNEYTSERNRTFLGYGIFGIGMYGLGIYFLQSMLNFESPSEYGFPIPLPYALALVALWTVLALSFAVSFFIKYSKHIVISNDGVLCKTFFKKEFLPWNEIKDYGFSFYEKEEYTLYFSKAFMQTVDYKTKKLKGKMIKFTVSKADYIGFVSSVLPYCMELSDVKPFVPVI